MRRLIKPLALATALLATSAHAGVIPCDNPCVIGGSNGGLVSQFVDQALQLRRAHTPVIVDGPCYSACTILVDMLDPAQVCVTHAAELGYHKAVGTGLDGRDWFTDLSFRTPGLNAYLKARGGLQAGPMITLRYLEATQFYRGCPELSRWRDFP